VVVGAAAGNGPACAADPLAQKHPTAWIGLELAEGKNRQVRRMTAAVGHPTLRLVRVGIGRLTLGDLQAGKWKILSPAERELTLE